MRYVRLVLVQGLALLVFLVVFGGSSEALVTARLLQIRAHPGPSGTMTVTVACLQVNST